MPHRTTGRVGRWRAGMSVTKGVSPSHDGKKEKRKTHIWNQALKGFLCLTEIPKMPFAVSDFSWFLEITQ